jgi:hypothetical protein
MLNRDISFKDRVIRDVKMYFEPLKWAVNAKKHPYGFTYFWGVMIIGIFLEIVLKY